MAKITFEFDVPDDQVDRVYNSFCHCHGWTETVIEIDEETGAETEVPNIQPQAEHFRETVIKLIRAAVIDHEIKESVNSARAVAIVEAQTIDIS
jgi:hypothetical protein